MWCQWICRNSVVCCAQRRFYLGQTRGEQTLLGWCYSPFGSLWLFSISHANRLAKLQLHTQGLPSSLTARREGSWLSAPTFRVDSALRSSSSSLREVRPRKASSLTMLRYGLLPSRSLMRLRDSPNVPLGISVRLLLPRSKNTSREEVLSVPGSMRESELFRRSRYTRSLYRTRKSEGMRGIQLSASKSLRTSRGISLGSRVNPRPLQSTVWGSGHMQVAGQFSPRVHKTEDNKMRIGWSQQTHGNMVKGGGRIRRERGSGQGGEVKVGVENKRVRVRGQEIRTRGGKGKVKGGERGSILVKEHPAVKEMKIVSGTVRRRSSGENCSPGDHVASCLDGAADRLLWESKEREIVKQEERAGEQERRSSTERGGRLTRGEETRASPGVMRSQGHRRGSGGEEEEEEEAPSATLPHSWSGGGDRQRQ